MNMPQDTLRTHDAAQHAKVKGKWTEHFVDLDGCRLSIVCLTYWGCVKLPTKLTKSAHRICGSPRSSLPAIPAFFKARLQFGDLMRSRYVGLNSRTVCGIKTGKCHSLSSEERNCHLKTCGCSFYPHYHLPAQSLPLLLLHVAAAKLLHLWQVQLISASKPRQRQPP